MKTSTDIYNTSISVGTINGKIIWNCSNAFNDIYFIKCDNAISALVSCWVAYNGHLVVDIKNKSDNFDDLTLLIEFLITKCNMSLVLRSNNTLSTDAFNWIKYVLTYETPPITLSDQAGNPLNFTELEKEWDSYLLEDGYGYTEIIIESINREL